MRALFGSENRVYDWRFFGVPHVVLLEGVFVYEDGYLIRHNGVVLERCILVMLACTIVG